ncbi:MAG: hypothetical protein K0V04_39240 [Deltaproteobacteria bacterium]|nr:hypothetical protein [Deltaproteobacteria bacterium]
MDDEGNPATNDESVAPVTASEILGQTGAEEVQWDAPLRPRVMTWSGSDDQIPDHTRQARPRDAAILLGLGGGLAVASMIAARMTLLPDCDDESDVTTCTIPDRADIGLRSGRLFGTVGFGVGAAAFGVFGARELGMLLQQRTHIPLERRRRIAVGVGTGSIAVGLTGIAVGSSVLAMGAKRSIRSANTFDDTTSIDDPETLAQIDEMVGDVKVARVGLMVLVASPAFLATGIALLVHRPRLERRVQITPTAGLTQFGVQATVRF